MDSAELATMIADALRASDRIAEAHVDGPTPDEPLGIRVLLTTQGGKTHEVVVR